MVRELHRSQHAGERDVVDVIVDLERVPPRDERDRPGTGQQSCTGTAPRAGPTPAGCGRRQRCECKVLTPSEKTPTTPSTMWYRWRVAEMYAGHSEYGASGRIDSIGLDIVVIT